MLVQEFGVSEVTAKHLARTYGMHAFEVCRITEPTVKRWPRFGHLLIEGYPYLECEIEYACKHEMVVSLKDMINAIVLFKQRRSECRDIESCRSNAKIIKMDT